MQLFFFQFLNNKKTETILALARTVTAPATQHRSVQITAEQLVVIVRLGELIIFYGIYFRNNFCCYLKKFVCYNRDNYCNGQKVRLFMSEFLLK